MAYSQGAEKPDILKELTFWVISSIQVSKLDRNKCLWSMLCTQAFEQGGIFIVPHLL
jgi:hypothetical protein